MGRKRKPIEMGIGGASWEGWCFGPWGKARDWFLLDPNGTRFGAREILELAMALHEVDYARIRLRELEALTASSAIQFTWEEAKALFAAATILERARPRLRRAA